MTVTSHHRPAVSVELQHEVEQFLFHEAELLDRREFEDWLDLFTDDLEYWVPTRHSLGRRQQQDFSNRDEAALFHDTKETLRFRVERLQSGFAWAEQPPTRTRHLVTNVRVAVQEADNLVVHSNFLVYCNRFETDVELFAGERRDALRRVDGRWLIAGRDVMLDQTVVLANSLSIFF